MTASTAKRKLFLGTFVHSKALSELEYLHDSAIAVDETGKIVAVDKDCGDLAKARETLLPRLGWNEADVEFVQSKDGEFFFPGFIDTHIHASQYPNAGIFGSSTLLDWLNTYTFPLESSLADPVKARRVYARVIRKTLAHGTTCAAYYATINVETTNLLADLCLTAGQRALVGRVCMDSALSPDFYKDASPEAGEEATRKCIAYIKQVDPNMDLVRPIITPRFAPACSAELMKRLGKLAEEENLPIQTHISENKNEIALVKELFPPAVLARATGDESLAKQHESTYAGVYDAFGLLTSRTILAHGVHLTPSELKLIADRGATISHCPCSNSSLASGAAPIRRLLLDHGIPVGLGTDVSGGYSASILEAAREAVLVSRHVCFNAPRDGERDKLSVEEVLWLATRGGARVVGLEGKVGAFEEGMEWDAQLVSLGRVVGEEGDGGMEDEVEGERGNVDVFGWESWPDRIAKWVYCGDDRNTKMVWVRGRLVHQRRWSWS